MEKCVDTLGGMTSVADVFALAAKRLTIVANQATPGPWRRSSTVEGALRCEDAADGDEQHLCYGIVRKEDFRLIVGADPEAVRLLASVFATADPVDASAEALADLAAYLGKKMGLSLPAIEVPATRRLDEFADAADL